MRWLLLALALGGCAGVGAAVEPGVPVVEAGMSGPLRPTLQQLALSPADVARVRAAPGDGRGVGSAITVGHMLDIYVLLRDRDLVFLSQAVLRERDQVFDVVTVRPRAGGGEQRLVFGLVPESADDLRVARLVRSVMTSGDGRGFGTAFATPSVPLEYEVLRLLGVQRTRQALVRQDGQAFDVLPVVDPVDGGVREVYFRLLNDPASVGVGPARRT